MRKLWLALLVMTVCAAQLFAQLQGTDEAMKSKCAKYEHTPLPDEATSVAIPKHWPNCDSYKLYAGKGTKPDFEAARRCAWAERLASQAGLEPLYAFGRVFGGSAMLTLLYTNGEGVEKNIPLAIRFACESGWAPGEIEGRVTHLEALDGKAPSSDSNFKFCDDIKTGFMEEYCESYDAQLADKARSDALDDLSSQWPEPQRAALAMLEKAETAYSEAHGKGEIDTAGASRAAQQIRAIQSVRDSFLAALRSFERGEFPHHSAEEAEQADAELNRVYHKATEEAEASKSNDGAVQPEDLLSTEGAWINYRDGWINFAKLRYPSVSSESWLTLLTRDRIATLQDGPCESDPDDSDCEQDDTQGPRPLP